MREREREREKLFRGCLKVDTALFTHVAENVPDTTWIEL
jgi:hypothetical protein